MAKVTHSVLIVNDASGDILNGSSRELNLVNLPHPKGLPIVFASVKDSIYELQQAEARRFGSWFINQRVSSDAGFYIANKIDPRLLILPFFEGEAGAKYSPLDQVVTTKDGCDRIPLAKAAKEWKLGEMLDIKDLGDDLVLFRFNKEKVLDLLQAKVNRAAVVISAHRKKRSKFETSVSTFDVSAQQLGTQASGTTDMEDEKKGQEDNQVEEPSPEDTIEAVQLVSDYLTDDMSKQLITAMGLNANDVNTVSMKGEKRKADWELEMELEKETMAYKMAPGSTSQNDNVQDSIFTHGVSAPKPGGPPQKKANNAAARLGKPKGTASIASFFGAPKKK